MFHIFTSLTAGASRRLAAVVSSFGCEMRANYIEKYLHCEKWGDFSILASFAITKRFATFPKYCNYAIYNTLPK
ncbi:hypothetical protein Flexsi_0296 [Flexistipes sinusarabici DSM 4947]|uniref:Uncharacterized protein n=1 Tax=Flexistipes sinusarabici (strain ATCC 49648 / DSM 4947 / MAS 10) TaxID=717231 RepID=F8E862_FLESM|nr:hypothetical protein Flexsi_0296 [Flexistipes sinusarabici DSM 4947]